MDIYRDATGFFFESSTLSPFSYVAIDLGEELEAIEVNPLAVLPSGQGAFAVDALVIKKGEKK